MSICNVPTHNESSLIRKVSWSLYALAAGSVFLRSISRISAFGGGGFNWDDGTILFTLLLLTPLNAILDVMVNDGLGQDIWVLQPAQITQVLFWFWIEEFLYTFIMSATKISILLLYLRMWPTNKETSSQRFQTSCVVIIAVLVVYAIALNTTLGLECAPIGYAWLRWDPRQEGVCINTEIQIFVTAAMNIFFDLLVILLPINKLLKLSIPRSKKIAVCITFTVGLFVTICSCVRLQYLVQWGTSANPTYQYTPIAIWSSVECNAGVFCACMPAMAGLVQRIWFKARGMPIGVGCNAAIHATGPRRSSSMILLRSPSRQDMGQLKHIPAAAHIEHRNIASSPTLDDIELDLSDFPNGLVETRQSSQLQFSPC